MSDDGTAWGRDESEACEAGTLGCSVLHEAAPDTDCEGW